MPKTIASVVLSGRATLKELDEFYSLEDLYDLLEMSAVDAYNQKMIAKHYERKRPK